MTGALKPNIAIGPGGVIEIRSTELPEGVHADEIPLFSDRSLGEMFFPSGKDPRIPAPISDIDNVLIFREKS